MHPTETVIEGTLLPDGTLELDEQPDLPPGRVTIRMQSSVALPSGDPFFDMLKDIWATRAAAGRTPRSVEEVVAQRAQLNDEMEQEILQAGQLQEDCRARRQQEHPPAGSQEC